MLSDDEKLKFLEQAIKDLGKPGNVDKFREAMKELGRRGAKTTDFFNDLWLTLGKIVAYHKEYPGVKPYLEEWDGYTKRWGKYVDISRNYAFQTGDDYQVYVSLLQGVGKITTKEKMLELAADVKEFAKSEPVVPVDFKDNFINLRRDVDDFQKRFFVYLDQQGITLTPKANELKATIDSLKTVIAGLHDQIDATTTKLGIAPWYGPVALAFSDTVLADLATPRAIKQNDLDNNTNNLKQLEAEQTPLGVVKAQLSGLAPDFGLLSANLNLFADVWNKYHSEALVFAVEFEKLETPPHFPPLFQRQIDLAITVSDALYNGMRDYVSGSLR